MPRGIIRTATTAIAIAALAAPTAFGRPADAPQAVAQAAAKAEQEQDLRHLRAGGHVVDAATKHERGARSPDAIDAATRPVLERPSAPSTSRPDTTPKVAADRGIAWATIGVGIVGGLLAIGAIAGITNRTRRAGRARITA